MTIVQWLYRVLLVLLAPRALRRRYGREMTATFDALARAARAQGWSALTALLMREAADLAAARRTHARHRHLQIPKGAPMPTVVPSFTDAVQLRVAARALRRRPAFVAAALATLVLGTTATTTVFTVVDTVLIKPLPYPDADRLVMAFEASDTNPGQTSLIAPGRLADWNRLNRSFTVISGFYAESVTDTSGTNPERLAGRRVAPSFFAVFGVDAIYGRTFSADEERAGGARAAVISDAFWRRRYGADPSALGRSLVIGNNDYVIVGIMPPNFELTPTDVWLPAQFAPGMLRARNARFVNGVGRMKPGVSIAQATGDLDRVQRELAAEFPQTDKSWSAALSDLKGSRVGEHQARLWLAFSAVALLWLIAITNVSGLVLVETHRRAREFAMRTALGASRARIANVVVQEVLLLALAGAALGSVVSYWTLRYVKLTFVTIPRMNELTLDWRALLFAAGTSTAAAVLCGLIPALSSTRAAQIHDATRGARGSTTTSHRLQRSLVVAQVALSVLLCTSALLLARSYANLRRVDVGYSADRVVAFHVAARWDEDRTRIGQLQQSIVEGLERMPDVDAAGMTSFLPVGNAPWRREVTVDGLRPNDSADVLSTGQRTVTAGYLRAIRVSLLIGDWCPPFNKGEPLSVMVNEAFARRFADAAMLVGQGLRLREFPATYTIAGIVANVAEDGPAVAAAPYVYFCAQPGDWPDPEYVVRAKNPAALMAGLRAAIREIDPTRAVFSVRPLSQIAETATAQPRISTGLIAALAAAAMLLAGTGLYGLFTLVVAQTRREMGVRLALGAAPRQLVRLVCVSAGQLLLLGSVLGLALTAGAGRWLQSMLFEIGPLDVVALLGTLLTVTTVSAMSILVPALRAARVRPSEALRLE